MLESNDDLLGKVKQAGTMWYETRCLTEAALPLGLFMCMDRILLL